MGRRSPECLRNHLERELMKLFDATGEPVYEESMDVVENLYYATSDDDALDAAEKLFDLLRYEDTEIRKLALKYAAAVIENL